jgi:hypothetical protein
MKIETILNAYDISYVRYCYIPEFDESKFGRRTRQHRAFRARILRMGNDSEEAYYNGVNVGLELMDTTIAEKDAKIDKLMDMAKEILK